MIAKGNYLWNSSIFLFKASTILSFAKQLAPEILAAVLSSVASSKQDNCFWHIAELPWERFKSQSFDHAILEKTDQISCVRFVGIWSDLGDWNSLVSILKKND